MATVGDNLRILRTERGMTQEDIANRLGITRFSIANYETDRREPNIKVLTQYSKLFNISIDDLTNVDHKSNVLTLMEMVERVFSDKDISLSQKESVMSDIMKCYLQNKDKGNKKGSQ